MRNHFNDYDGPLNEVIEEINEQDLDKKSGAGIISGIGNFSYNCTRVTTISFDCKK